MFEGLKTIRRERAAMERDRVVFGSMLESKKIEDAFHDLDEHYFEGVEDEEIDELIARIPESDEEDEQIDRIVNAEDDLDIDAILGVDADTEIEELVK